MKHGVQSIYQFNFIMTFRNNNCFLFGRCVYSIPNFVEAVIDTQEKGLHCWFNWSLKANLILDFVISVDFSERKFCCGPCLVWQCCADCCSAMEPVCYAFVTSLHCLLLFQLWMNPPLTMVSKGYRRLSPGTLVTLNACQRSASSLLFY